MQTADPDTWTNNYINVQTFDTGLLTILGPALNGTNMSGFFIIRSRRPVPSCNQRLGSNKSASGPHRSFRLCISIGKYSTLVPAGIYNGVVSPFTFAGIATASLDVRTFAGTGGNNLNVSLRTALTIEQLSCFRENRTYTYNIEVDECRQLWEVFPLGKHLKSQSATFLTPRDVDWVNIQWM